MLTTLSLLLTLQGHFILSLTLNTHKNPVSYHQYHTKAHLSYRAFKDASLQWFLLTLTNWKTIKSQSITFWVFSYPHLPSVITSSRPPLITYNSWTFSYHQFQHPSQLNPDICYPLINPIEVPVSLSDLSSLRWSHLRKSGLRVYTD